MNNTFNRNRFKKSTLAIAIGVAFFASNSYAAENEELSESEVEVITVTSSKTGLIRALDYKREADSIMDGITASELGAFPDANVADSLSHITGVSIDRTSGGEGKGVNIRGLGAEFSIVTINDRIMATDSSGREFAFDVLPSEVISEAWVFKSATASQLEGSIGGTINLKTARPFDNKGTHGSASLTGQYGEQAEKYGYKMTGVGTHTFANDTMGVLFSGLYSRTPTRTDSLSDNNFRAASADNWNWDRNGDGETNDPADRQLVFPSTIAYTAYEENKERTALSGVFQYRPSDKLDVVFDALWTRLDTPVKGYTASYYFPDSSNWRDVEFGGPTTDLNPDGIQVVGVTVDNLVPQLVTLEEHRVVDTFNVGLNATYTITDNSILSGDIYMSNAKREAGGKDRFVVAVPIPGIADSTTARMTLNDAGIPSIDIDFHDNEAGISEVSDFVGNGQFGPHFTRLEGVDIEDEVIGASLRHEIFLDMAVLEGIEYGAVYNKRTKTRTQLDNAATMSLYSGAPFSFADVGADVVEPFPFDNFLNNAVGNFPREFATFNVEKAFEAVKAADGNPNIINPVTGLPYEEGYSDGLFPTWNSDLSGAVEEETISLYLQGNFRTEFNSIIVSGNVGLRYVETETTSSGWDWPIAYIDQAPADIWTHIVVHGERTPISISKTYNELLPSVNFQFELSEELVVRLSYAEVMARASIDQLSTQIDTSPSTWGDYRINKLGNPGLTPVTAQQADISVEWYYKEGSSVSAAIFQKDIAGFVQSGQDIYLNDRENQPVYSVLNPQPWDPQGFEDVSFSVNQPENLDQAKVLGYEFSLQHFFDSGFGIVSNYTYIDTESIVDGFNEGVLEGIPDTTYSLNLMYNDDFMSLSISAYHTESYISSHWSPLNITNEEGSTPSVYKSTATSSTWSSASATFYLAEGLETFIQADNILNEDWHGYNGLSNMPGSGGYAEWGRKYSAGVRYKF
ncbi:TonB-dependent receptor [Colwellia sp. 20A7]|uniref:TonB-dependent receptor n=1 Tax=Colwellia sp. 20A7 TaxID=2689569 RepID=UPI001357EDAA|nr:TonB-dependent receptor [Colwellia sp. 20A7]